MINKATFFREPMDVSTLILVALGVGALFGATLHYRFPGAIVPLDQYVLDPVGQGFLRLIQFVVVPLVFSSLILGLTRIQNAGQVGRYLVKLITSYAVTSAIALGIGMTMAWLLQPGVGVEGSAAPMAMNLSPSPSLIHWLVSLIPTNPLAALSRDNLLQVIFTGALVGVGIQLAQEKAQPVIDLLESIYAIAEKTLSVILYVAPLGVFALISSVIATDGLELVAHLLLYVLGLLLSSAVMVGVYVSILLLLKANPVKFFTSLAEALFLAFGTASSNAALPIVLQNLQENYGLPSEIVSFAIPLGTALKRDGAAILQGFNALFIAQLYHVPLTPAVLLAIGLSSFLVSFSTPGIPGAALITMTTVLAAAGLPLEGVAIVAGVDRITDGFKTVLNVIGNTVNAIILSAWEKKTISF